MPRSRVAEYMQALATDMNVASPWLFIDSKLCSGFRDSTRGTAGPARSATKYSWPITLSFSSPQELFHKVQCYSEFEPRRCTSSCTAGCQLAHDTSDESSCQIRTERYSIATPSRDYLYNLCTCESIMSSVTQHGGKRERERE